MPAERTLLTTIDEDARRQFEAAWRAGQPQSIERFLPPEDHAQYPGTLEELVHIELENGWKAGQAAGAEPSRPPLVEAYLARFPRLNQAPIIRRLLQQEYRVRQRFGDAPALGEYRQRFPTLVLAEGVEGTLAGSTAAVRGLPVISGYEVLQVIAKGGMGVVYKARQVRLDRIVAVKMILAGAHANAAELARFRTEAAAVAQLQHPNIVQVYEVGDHDGCPYLALEFVDGGTLAQQLAGTPQPVRPSAQLLETVAWAIHAAHQKGVVHRDLKPANVLLQRSVVGGQKPEVRSQRSEVGSQKSEEKALGEERVPAAAADLRPLTSDLCPR
jgi:serine/threonine-protein kinase